MSWQAVAAARRHRVGHASWKAVLLVIADHAHPDGTGCTSKYATLAADAECSLPTVKRAVPAMLAAGVLHGAAGDLSVEMNETIDMREGVTTTPERSHRDQTVSNDSVSPRHQPASPRHPVGITVIPLEEPTQNRPRTNSASDDPDFIRFWDAYPRRKDKGAARRAWRMAVKKADAETIITAAASYASLALEERFTKYPASWLNAEAWENDLVAATAPSYDANGHRRC